MVISVGTMHFCDIRRTARQWKTRPKTTFRFSINSCITDTLNIISERGGNLHNKGRGQVRQHFRYDMQVFKMVDVTDSSRNDKLLTFLALKTILINEIYN